MLLTLGHGAHVKLVSAGSAPFYHSPKGDIIIPHGYVLQSEFEGRIIFAETKVFVYDNIPRVEYQFSTVIKDDFQLDGGFQISPYLASMSLVARLGNIGIPFADFDKSSNNNFHMGLTSENVQQALRRFHRLSPSSKMKRELF
ncbi:hypothetical protein BASA81_001325 [Batrachochytrium salamandrivorans]|nr:hypothetical protein BASA81_001325 [Batrachochytrium salamandrivorans]